MCSLLKSSLIIFVYIDHASTKTVGVCSNVSDGSPLECCANYRVVGNSCEECWPGTHGIQCMENCPANRYGRLCLEICTCEPCDLVNGQCSNATHTRSNNVNSEEDESPTNFATWLTLSVLTTCFVICFLICPRIFCIARRMSTEKPTDLVEYDSKRQMVSLENPRRSASLTSRTNDTETRYTQKDDYHPTDPNGMTDTTSQNGYGHVDSMDGSYNILKLTVSDSGNHVQHTNNYGTPLDIPNKTKVDGNLSQVDSTISNIVQKEESKLKKIMYREKRKQQKQLLRTLDDFKKGSTRDRKKLRYSFTKSTELF